MADEEVIKRRLLIDGDGTGEDKKLNFILKTFVKLCNSVNEDESTILSIKEQLLNQLSQTEYLFEKWKISTQMNNDELRNYDILSNEISTHVDKTKKTIELSKDELQKAKLHRKNGLEREVITNVIEKHPTRQETEAKLEVIQKHITNLEESKKELNNKLESRKKHFHVLVASLQQLQSLLDTEESDGEADCAQVNISDDEMDISSDVQS